MTAASAGCVACAKTVTLESYKRAGAMLGKAALPGRKQPGAIDALVVVAAALKESGFDAERLLARTQEQDIKDKLLKNTQEAVDRGTFGSPTFFVGKEIFFGKDRLRDVEEEIVRCK